MLFDTVHAFAAQSPETAKITPAVTQLLAGKKSGKETDKQPKDSALDAYIQARIAHYQSFDFGKPAHTTSTEANSIFRKILHSLQ